MATSEIFCDILVTSVYSRVWPAKTVSNTETF